MAQLPMYASMVNSPGTELAADINATDTEITILDASKLPAAPNLVTVGGDETAETIRYAGKTGNTLTGCTRGFEGTAKGWAAGTQAARNHTAYDYEAGRANIADVNTRVDNTVIPDGTTAQKGIVQLSDATGGTRSTVAATEKAVSDARLSVDGKIGNLANLNTADKSNVVAALNEVFTHVGDGKNLIETAVIVKGGTVAGTSPHSFEELVGGIETIPTATVINGQLQQSVTYGSSIAAYDPIYAQQTIGSSVSLPSGPTTAAVGVSLSSNGLFMALVTTIAPYLYLYKISGGVFTLLPSPTSLPTGSCQGCTFSADSGYLAVAHNTAPYLTIYKVSGDTFTKLANPTTLPTGRAYAAAFSPDGNYLAAAHDTSPYVTIYKRSGDTFTKLANPSILPPATGLSVSFSPDGAHLVVGHAGSPFVTIYKRSGDAFTKLPDLSPLPVSNVSGSAFSSDGTYLATCHAGSPFVTIYKRSGDTFTKLSDPSILPTGNGLSITFSPDGMTLAVGHTSSPFVTLYKRSGDAFTKLPDLSPLPISGTIVGIYGCAFSFSYFVAVGNGAPYFTVYTAKLTAYKSNTAIGSVQQVSALGYALESGSTNDTKDAILIWR